MATTTATYTILPSVNSIMCQSNAGGPNFQRRLSFRRDTLSSMVKDVRVVDPGETIKQQKAIQQKERIIENSMLRRRHSMLNMSSRVPAKRHTLLPRTHTMSNSELRVAASNAASNITDNNASVAARSATQYAVDTTNTTKLLSGRTRLDEKNTGKCKSPTLIPQEHQLQRKQPQETVISHLRKCSACHEKKEISLASKGGKAAAGLGRPHESSITSASFSSDDTVSSCSSLSSSYKNNAASNDNPQRSSVIKELKKCMSNYTTQMNQMLSDNENNIQACKSLIVQQQDLLRQLEELDSEPSRPASPPAPPSSPSMDLLKNVFALRPKTQIVIRQTADKNEADTIFSLQGVCTTAEKRHYIPDEIKSTANSSNQFSYTLNLSHQDRLNKFVLKPVDQWQPDQHIDVCQDKQCDQGFNWFQRKHHCRSCGNIYCSTHSGNRLPLFTGDASASNPTFSRVCDACFYQLVGHSLKPL
ncbi:hypothetical protein [Parasitella parasitica]|uniref:FYVE-type domain-containing protein n=1 Tax=Parasitella parasitica TaxID=35722 RepID=A0A0B7NQD7_9FUNG|nr:hypothetical protein [Parasitella parasitica]